MERLKSVASRRESPSAKTVWHARVWASMREIMIARATLASLSRILKIRCYRSVTTRGPAFGSPKVARGAAYADIDNDGALDVLMTTNRGRAYLFHNEGGANHSLRIKLVGTKSNRDGIGAIVRVSSGKDQQWQMLRSGS